MTTYTALSDTTLAQDKPLTQSVSRALRDNPLAIREGDATAPKVEVVAMNNGAFYATTGASGFTIGSGGVIPFDNEVLDVSGWYSASTYRYTPQKAGYYLVTYKLGQGTGGTAADGSARIVKNSTIIAGSPVEPANALMSPVSIIVPMNGSTDYLFCDVVYGAGSFTAGGGNSNIFSAVLIAAT